MEHYFYALVWSIFFIWLAPTHLELNDEWRLHDISDKYTMKMHKNKTNKFQTPLYATMVNKILIYINYEHFEWHVLGRWNGKSG